MEKALISVFKLQFALAQIKGLAARYEYQDDTEALEAGQRIIAGDYSRANIEAIFRWKTGGRGISRLRRNSDIEIRDALRLAVNAETERGAISVLCGLSASTFPSPQPF